MANVSACARDYNKLFAQVPLSLLKNARSPTYLPCACSKINYNDELVEVPSLDALSYLSWLYAHHRQLFARRQVVVMRTLSLFTRVLRPSLLASDARTESFLLTRSYAQFPR